MTAQREPVFPAIGSRCLTPDMHEGVLEEVHPGDGMALVRHVAWDGGRSVLATWYWDVSVLRPLPEGWVRPVPTSSDRIAAAALWDRIEEALHGIW